MTNQTPKHVVDLLQQIKDNVAQKVANTASANTLPKQG